jgi:PIN domain nuclease of toxin-antitoxin system
VRLLLDTQCWLWLKYDSSRFPSPLRRRIVRDPTRLVLSSVSVMEIVIKHGNGKLELDGTPAALISEFLEDGVSALAMTGAHALQLGRLPPLHRDPFDRLLVAQALSEGLTVVSGDPQVLAYNVAHIDARK